MNLKTTLVLLVLAAAGAALWWVGPALPPALDLGPRPPAVTDLGTRAELAKLRGAHIRRIELRAGDRLTVLEHKADGSWSMPGNWPTRAAEAQALADRLAGLSSRFEPEPATSDTELAQKGLHPPALTVEVTTDEQVFHLALGEPPASLEGDRFARPTYLRLGKRNEVLRLAPGLVGQLDRPADYFQQRRLFPADRVVKDPDSTEKVERLAASRVSVEDKKEGGSHYTLVRNGDTWELAEPVRDRLEARARDALLSALPDVWAESFVHADTRDLAARAAAGAAGDPLSAALAAFLATPRGLLVKSGLASPEQVVTVTTAAGDPVTLLIGRTSGSRARKVLRPPPPGLPPGMEPREETVQDEYRYAKLKDNDQVFEIKAGKLKDVFVSLDTLRDPSVAPFSTADARRVEITQGGTKTVLAKENDRWRLVEPVRADADASKVTDLLSKISTLQARDKDVIDKGDPKTYGLDRPGGEVKVTLEEEVKDARGEKTKKTRTLSVRLGKHDEKAKKLYVQADDWPRINAVDDSLDALVRRPALAYRGKRVLDFGTSELAKIEVKRGAESYTLEHTKDGWRLTSPVSAPANALKADQVAGTLGSLEAVEYADQMAKPDDLEARFGLGKPAITVRLEFTDKNKPARVLEVGKAQGGKPGTFARLADAADKTTPVFVISREAHDALDRDSLAYRPTQLWQVPAEDVAAVRVRRAGEAEYRLTRDGAGWKVGGPFEAPALTAAVQTLVNDLAAPQAQSYKAHEAKDLAPYGLDRPHVSVTVSAKDGKEHTLLVGASAGKEGPGRSAKLADSPAVFVVNDTLAHAADRAALDLLDPVLLHLDTARVERVTGKSGEAGLTLERTEHGWRVTDAPGSPFPADTEAVAGLEGLWADLRAERFAAYGPGTDWAKYGLDRPAVSVTVRLKPADKGPAERTVELGKPVEGSAGGRYARVDRGAGVAVLGSGAAKILGQGYLDYVNRNVLEFDAGAVVSVQRSMGGDTLEVVKKDGGWQLIKPADERADDRAMQELLDRLGRLRARRIAAYPAKDLAPFGLERPAALVTVKLSGDRKPAEHVLKVGKPTENGGDRYAQVDNGPAVAVLPAGLADRLVAGPVAFRDRNLAHFADADKVRLQRGPRRATFARVEGTWKLTEPLEAPAEQDDLDDFVAALGNLRADALVADKPGPEELKKYGLDRPEARWRLEAGDKEVLSLIVGGPEENGPRRYARLAGRDLVFLLDPGLSGRVLAEYRTRAVWSPAVDASQVESLRYGYARNPFTLEKADGTWQAAGKPGAKVSAEKVNDTLAALAGLKAARWVVDKGADPKLFGLEKPELVLEVATRSAKQVLEVGGVEGGSKRRYARVPGPDRTDVFVLDEADCARLFRDLAGFSGP
jgi:hypothetical protein